MIAAATEEGVIGKDGRIPWSYPLDLRRFRRLTIEATVIMGRETFETIGRPLAQRRNLVVTSRAIPGVECFRSLGEALAVCDGPVWLIGGARIFEEGLGVADFIDLTTVPDHVEGGRLVRFPAIDRDVYEEEPTPPHDDPRLMVRRYVRRRSGLAKT